MAGNNKEAAISVNYFKTFQCLVDSILALLIKLMLFELRPVACVSGNLEKIQEKISGSEKGEETFQMGCLPKKRQGKTWIHNCSISSSRMCSIHRI